VLHRRRVLNSFKRRDWTCGRDHARHHAGSTTGTQRFRHPSHRAVLSSDGNRIFGDRRSRRRSLSCTQGCPTRASRGTATGIKTMLNDIGKQAYGAMRHNRRRSMLTMLGMAWGIATVVLLLAYGSGFQRGLMAAFTTFGGNLIAIFPGRTELQAGGTKAGTEVRLTIKDLENLRAEVPFLRRSSPESNKQSLVAYGQRSATYMVRGTFSSYQQCRHVDVGEGSFFDDQQDLAHMRVAVIGNDVKKKLFSGQNAIGESVRIDGISYQVVGVIKKMLSNGEDNMNAMVYIPYSTMSDL